jgi:cysteine desulfurase
MTKAPIYLDYAAATPMDERVLEAMRPYFTAKFYNPSATYLAAKAISKDILAARTKVAHWLGAQPTEIIFTAGGTEANNLAIQGVLQQFPDANVVVSAIEHESVLAPARLFANKELNVDEQGSIKLADLKAAIDDQTVLVSIMYANNEVGTIQPLREVAGIVQHIRDERRRAGNTLPLYFHTDACQAANYLDLHAARLGVDLMTLNGGKMYGPKQSGVLYVHSNVQLHPQILGGGQERNLRSGTENVAATIGFAEALEIVQTIRHDEAKRLTELQHYFYERLAAKLPTAVVHGSKKKRLPNNVHITIPGTDNERVLVALDEVGILAAAGSACSASDEEPSHVLRAMGVSDADAQSSLRFTMGRSTDRSAIDQTISVLVGITTADLS